MNEKSTKKADNSPGPKPERAIYGFFCLSFAILIFIIYVMVAYLPDSVLNAFGWDYLPEKHWMLITPYLIVITMLMVYPVYFFINSSVVCSFNSINSIKDEFSLDINTEKKTNETKETSNSIDPVYDIPISEICQKLYLKKY
jgi:phosphatidylinositol N-acetylglucosaminyltransferase subunit P